MKRKDTPENKKSKVLDEDIYIEPISIEPKYDDIYFDEPAPEGVTLVDAYYVENHIVGHYIELREKYATAIAKVYSAHGYQVSRDWAGTEDGEAVIAYDQQGEIVAFIHLDPYETDRLYEAEQKGQLTAAIEESLPL